MKNGKHICLAILDVLFISSVLAIVLFANYLGLPEDIAVFFAIGFSLIWSIARYT